MVVPAEIEPVLPVWEAPEPKRRAHSVVYKVAKQGRGLIFGHGSQILLQDFSCALHIRIYAPEKTRIHNLITKRGFNQTDAKKIIHRRDDKLNGFFQYAFWMDYNDPILYDLIINTGKIGVEQAAIQIISPARSDVIKSCSLKDLGAMERLHLEKKIQAKLIRRSIFTSTVIIKVHENNVVNIRGMAMDDEERDKIIRTVEALPEISKVEDKIYVNAVI